MTAVDIDQVARLIAARCPELTPSDLSAVEAALSGGEAMISREVAEGILEVLDLMEQRLEAMEAQAA